MLLWIVGVTAYLAIGVVFVRLLMKWAGVIAPNGDQMVGNGAIAMTWPIILPVVALVGAMWLLGRLAVKATRDA